ACSLITRDEPVRLQTQAVAPTSGAYPRALSLERRENAASALWALEHGAIVGGSHGEGDGPLGTLVFYVPLKSGRRVVGVLGIAPAVEIRGLVRSPSLPHQGYDPTGARVDREPQLTLFAAFCDQIALALDRFALQSQAIHAEALRESDRLKDTLL